MAVVKPVTVTVRLRFTHFARAAIAALRLGEPHAALARERNAHAADLKEAKGEIESANFACEQWRETCHELRRKLNKADEDLDALKRALDSANDLGAEWQTANHVLRDELKTANEDKQRLTMSATHREAQLEDLAAVIELKGHPHTIPPGTPAERVRLLMEAQWSDPADLVIAEADRATPKLLAQVILKEHHELRHFLAHLYAAVEAVRTGHSRVAEQELESIAGLVFFDNDTNESLELELTRREHHGSTQETQPVQG